MVCLESVFAGLRRVCFFVEELTVSDRKRGNLNFTLLGPGDMWSDPVEDWLSLDNQSDRLHTGDH
ncbi:hypothetical protein FQZ97_566050 [compost metagenome]